MNSMTKKLSLLTVVISKELATVLIDILKNIGMQHLNITPGRRIFLKQRKGMLKIFGEQSLIDEPVVYISFLLAQENERDVMNLIIERTRLNIPGKGCIYSREVVLLKTYEGFAENRVQHVEVENKYMHTDLKGLSCIVQKGEGNDLARVGLDTGIGVPGITFGTGTGLRDKLGLWRITFPADKEIINFVTNSQDAEHLMDLLISIGSLNQPGKGFVYLYPVRMGLINTKFYAGMTRQVASIEQVVSVIDELKGGMSWRNRDFLFPECATKRIDYLEGLVNLTVICNEGKASELIRNAMDAGAGGATTSKCRHLSLDDSKKHKISPSREMSIFIVPEKQISQIVTAIEEHGALDDETQSQIYMSHTSKVFSYFGPQQKSKN
jgi:nitrogen regulatory protein PII